RRPGARAYPGVSRTAGGRPGAGTGPRSHRAQHRLSPPPRSSPAGPPDGSPPPRPVARPARLLLGRARTPERRPGVGKVSEKLKAVAAAVAAIEEQFGEGAVLQLGRAGEGA